MKNLRNVVILGIVLVSVGCGEVKNKAENNNSSYGFKETVKTVPPQRTEDKQEKKVLENMGIEVESGKIVIDTKKTEEFFDRIGRTLEREVNKMEKGLDKPDSSDIGVKVKKDKIEIDLNKTKSFLENFAKGMQKIAKEINATLAQ